MPKWTHTDVLDNGLNEIVNNGDVLHVISAYAAADNYATVTGNSVANYSLAGGDKTLAAHATTGRKVTIGAKSGNNATATAASPDLHLAVVDSVNSKVLYVTDETSDQPITSGNPVNTPAFDLQLPQPV